MPIKIVTILFFLPILLYGQWRLDFNNSDTINCLSFSLEKSKISTHSSSFENSVLIRDFDTLLTAKKDVFTLLSAPILLKLKRGGQFRCEALKIKDNSLIVQTGFAGSFAVPIVDISELIFLGAASSSNSISAVSWKDRSKWLFMPASFAGNFKVLEGKILLKAPLIWAIECPFKKVKISFSAFVNYDYGLSIQLFSNLKTNGLEAYSLYLLPYLVDAFKIVEGSKKSLVNKRLNEVPVESFVVKYEIAADYETGVFEIVLNNRTKFKFNDNDEKKIAGNKVAFICSNGFNLISDLQISEWDKKPLQVAGEGSSQQMPSSNSDTLFLRNNDCLSGTLLEVSADIVQFQTDFATLKIPIERIAKIAIKNPDNNDRKQIGADTKFSHLIILGNSSFFELNPLSCDSKVLLAQSSMSKAPLNIDLAYVKELGKKEITSEKTQSNSLFDEIVKLESFNFSIDKLDEKAADKMKEELGDLFDVLNDY